MKALVNCGVMFVASAVLVGCSIDAPSTETDTVGTDGKLGGEVRIDGSSTVFPISQAVAEEFQAIQPEVKVVVGTSGTGGGFKKFIGGETDINDASRPIKDSEVKACAENGIEFIELKIAIDGLSVVVHPENDWCEAMTTAQLKSLWEPGSKISRWNQIDPSWPDEEIKLYGPDKDSGTFDYFTEEICGEGGATRTEYTPSTDDNVLVTGVSGDKYALGYFGYAYYAENSDKVRALGIADGDDVSLAVSPDPETIEGGSYKPLSRPLFLYINRKSLAKPQVAEFLRYYLSETGQKLVSDVGYVKLDSATVEAASKALEAGIPEMGTLSGETAAD